MRRLYTLALSLLFSIAFAGGALAESQTGSGAPPPTRATLAGLDVCPATVALGTRVRVTDQGGRVHECRSTGWVDVESAAGSVGSIDFGDILSGSSSQAYTVGNSGSIDWSGTGSVNARYTANTRWSRSIADWKACIEAGDGARNCILTPGRYDAGTGLDLVPATSASGSNGSLVAIACQGATIYSSAANVSVGGGGFGAVVSISLSALQHDTEVVISGCRIDGSPSDNNETGLYLSSATGSGGASGRVRIEGMAIGESGLQEGTERGLWYDRSGLAYTLVMSDSRIQAAGIVFDWEFGARGMIANTLINTIGTATARCFDWGSGNTITDSYAGFLSVTGLRFVGCGAGAIRTKTGLVIGDLSLGGLIGSAASDEPVWTVTDGNMLDVQIGYQGNANEGTAGPLIYMESDDLAARVTLTEAGCQYLTLNPEIFEGAAGVVPRYLSAEVSSGAVACSGGTPFGNTLLAEDRTGSRGLVRLHGTWHEYVGNTSVVVRPASYRAMDRLVFGSSTGTAPNTSGCLATALAAYQTTCTGPGATNQARPVPAGTVVYAFSCARGGSTAGWDGGETVDVQLATWNGSAWSNVTGALVQIAESDALGDLKAATAFTPVTIGSDTTLAALTPAFSGSGMTMDMSCHVDVVLP